MQGESKLVDSSLPAALDSTAFYGKKKYRLQNLYLHCHCCSWVDLTCQLLLSPTAEEKSVKSNSQCCAGCACLLLLSKLNN